MYENPESIHIYLYIYCINPVPFTGVLTGVDAIGTTIKAEIVSN